MIANVWLNADSKKKERPTESEVGAALLEGLHVVLCVSLFTSASSASISSHFRRPALPHFRSSAVPQVLTAGKEPVERLPPIERLAK